jgi:hypothetical protein
MILRTLWTLVFLAYFGFAQAASTDTIPTASSDGVPLWVFILAAYVFVCGLIALPLVRPPLMEWYRSSDWFIFGTGPVDILLRQVGFRLGFELFIFGISCVIGSLGGAIYAVSRRLGGANEAPIGTAGKEAPADADR